MNFSNAIAKARFSSAKPQRVQLYQDGVLQVDLLCLESGQEMALQGRWSYYLIAGSGEFSAGGQASTLSVGGLAVSDDEPHRLANKSQQRLVCLATSRV